VNALPQIREPLRRYEIEQALAVRRNERVEINERPERVRRALGDTGDHHAAVGVATEDNVGQVLALKHTANVSDVRVKIDVSTHQVRPLTQARQGGRVDLMARQAQQRRDPPPAPAAVPRAVDEDECRQGSASA
jgi:hypothetical protein